MHNISNTSGATKFLSRWSGMLSNNTPTDVEMILKYRAFLHRLLSSCTHAKNVVFSWCAISQMQDTTIYFQTGYNFNESMSHKTSLDIKYIQLSDEIIYMDFTL